jgi:adenylate cyclase
MAKPMTPNEGWQRYITGGDPLPKWQRRMFRALPHDPRCKLCSVPFEGIGGRWMRMAGYGRSRKNPRFCNICEVHLQKTRGGAEVPLSFLFADVRGSTALAEQMSAAEFSVLLNRFYAVANRVLIESDAWVDKLVGDEVIGFFPPYLTDHPRRALRTALELLEATGHRDHSGPWIRVGVGVHTGRAFFGAVGTAETITDVTALGDNVNIAARLAQLAGPGELLVSEAAYVAAGVELKDAESRTLELKGRTEPIAARLVRVTPALVGAP